MATFDLEQFDPCPLSKKGVWDGGEVGTQVVALDIQSKYLFVDDTGETYHEYFVPGTSDIQNCGGYVDKVIQYRAPALLNYLISTGVSQASFAAGPFPILGTRSPKLDLLLFDLIRHLRESFSVDRVSLLDHGCTVAEHYDMLDLMLKADSGSALSAPKVLSYCGLDKSSMLLTIARLLHRSVPEDHFQLVHVEGSSFSFAPREFDLSLSVGVINHTANPTVALEKILLATRYACVLAIWVTTEEKGFWAMNHSGVSHYFFSRSDLKRLARARGEGRFLSVEYTPETQASQLRSYVGLGEERLGTLGSYHMVFTTLGDLPFQVEAVEL